MKILLVSATTSEISTCINHFDNCWDKVSFLEYTKNELQVFPLITGIGSMMMAFALARYKNIHEMDLVFHVGISGSYHKEINIAEVVEVISEQWADLGAEDPEGKLIDGFELGLMHKDRFPYKGDKLLKTRKTISTGLKQVAGLTVNKTSGSHSNIDRINMKFQADVESMEGAGLFYACNVMDLPFISIRAISNYVEPRNKTAWKMQESIDNLNTLIIELLEKIRAAH